jgi:muramoyltetrapeptide carboxypeptidase
LLRAPKLSAGDVVRIIAPAGPFDPEPFERGLEVLKNRFGLLPRMREDIVTRTGYLAGSDARRLEEFAEAAADPEAKAIWCARGGYGSMRLLPKLDFQRLIRFPKLFVGFSDITAIHAALNRLGLITIHGPVVTQLGRAPEDVHDAVWEMVSAPRLGQAGLDGSSILQTGRASGPLLGGSLTILSHLVGTPYLPSLRGAVLFIEDVGEKPYRLDRYLTQLMLSGALTGVNAVAVGQLLDCEGHEPGAPAAEGELSAAEVVAERIRALNVPAIAGIRVGHENTNYPLPLGAIATVVAEEGQTPRLEFNHGAVT